MAPAGFFPTTLCHSRDSNLRQSESCTSLRDLRKDALPTELPRPWKTIPKMKNKLEWCQWMLMVFCWNWRDRCKRGFSEFLRNVSRASSIFWLLPTTTTTTQTSSSLSSTATTMATKTTTTTAITKQWYQRRQWKETSLQEVEDGKRYTCINSWFSCKTIASQMTQNRKSDCVYKRQF